LFLGYAALGSLWSSPVGTHLITAAKYAEYAVLALALPLLVRHRRALVALALVLALWSLLATVVALVQFAGGDIFQAWTQCPRRRHAPHRRRCGRPAGQRHGAVPALHRAAARQGGHEQERPDVRAAVDPRLHRPAGVPLAPARRRGLAAVRRAARVHALSHRC